MPEFVLSIYGFVQFFNGDTSAVLHWECIEGSHFTGPWVILSGIGVAAMAQLGMFLLTGHSKRHIGRKIVYPKVQKALFVPFEAVPIYATTI